MGHFFIKLNSPGFFWISKKLLNIYTFIFNYLQFNYVSFLDVLGLGIYHFG